MNDEQKKKLNVLKKTPKEIKLVTSDDLNKEFETRKKEYESISKSIQQLASAVNVKVEIHDLSPLIEKLEKLSDLPDSFKTIKELASKVHTSLSEEKEIGIKGFRDLWELVVHQNNRIDKAHNESIKEVVTKFADLRVYLDQLTETLKQGQDPEDFKPVRLVIGGKGTPLQFLENMPTNRSSGGGGNLFVNGNPVTSANPIPVDIQDATIEATISSEVEVKNDSGNPVPISGTTAVSSVIAGTGATNLGKAVDSVGGATDTGVAALALRDDVLTTMTPVDGDYVRVRTDQYGSLWVSLGTLISGEDQTNNLQAVTQKPVASSSYTGTAFAAFSNDVDISVKASAGNLLSILVSNINAAIRYLQIHNKATAPTSGNAPVFSIPIPAGSSTSPSYVELGREFFGQHGHHLATGIAIGISTVEATFTAATTTDHNINGTYI